MARRKTRTRTVVRYIRRGASRVSRLGNPAMRTIKEKAREEQHLITAVVSAGVLGYMERQGWTEKLPLADQIGAPAAVGLGAYILGRFSKGNMARNLRHVATGMLSVAAYQFVKEGRLSGPGPYMGPVITPQDDIYSPALAGVGELPEEIDAEFEEATPAPEAELEEV